MGYKSAVNKFASGKTGSWIARTVSARVDPVLYKLTRGRVTSVGVQTLPQLVLTTTGRKSGRPRQVQLAYTEDAGSYLVVASNFGQEHHPAWMYNLEADPDARIRLGKDQLAVHATQLTDAEKTAVWPRLVGNVPNYSTYVERTDRNLRVFRLTPV